MVEIFEEKDQPIMKHILFITPGFAANERDSQCIPPLQLLAKKLNDEQDIQVSIVSLHYPYTNENYIWNGISVYSSFRKAPLKKVRVLNQARKWIGIIHKKNPIDIIHSFWLTDSALIGQVLSKKLGLPHLITLMGQDARPSNKYLRFFDLKNCYCVTLSNYHQKQLIQTSGVKAKWLIPWGLDKNDLKPAQRKEYDIIGVGNLIKLKDYSLFIQLIHRLKEVKPDLKALIIGGGEEESTLKEQIKSLGLQEQIQLLGTIPRTEVLDYLSKGKIFLHTSEYESFGYVFLEALAAGMHIVSKPVGIAETDTNWAVETTEEGLYSALENKLLLEAITSSFIKNSIENTVKAYLKVYGEL